VIVHQHPPEDHGLETTLQHLLGSRLLGSLPPEADPLKAMAEGMQQLAVADAEQQLVRLLQQISA